MYFFLLFFLNSSRLRAKLPDFYLIIHFQCFFCITDFNFSTKMKAAYYLLTTKRTVKLNIHSDILQVLKSFKGLLLHFIKGIKSPQFPTPYNHVDDIYHFYYFILFRIYVLIVTFELMMLAYSLLPRLVLWDDDRNDILATEFRKYFYEVLLHIYILSVD